MKIWTKVTSYFSITSILALNLNSILDCILQPTVDNSIILLIKQPVRIYGS